MTRTRSMASALLALMVLVPTSLAQTAATIGNEQDTLATIIPGTCSTTCQLWLTTYGTCPAATSTATTTAFNTCVCDAAFITAFTTCTTCMTTALTAGNDPQEALPATGLTDLTAYCAAVSGGTVATPAVTTTTTTTTTTTAAAITTTTAAATPAATPASTSSDSATSSAPLTPTSATPVVITQTFSGQGFPTQTKSTNVFTGAAGRVEVACGAMLVAFGAIWFA